MLSFLVRHSRERGMGIDTARVVRSELLETSLQELICIYCLDLVDPGDALQVRIAEHWLAFPTCSGEDCSHLLSIDPCACVSKRIRNFNASSRFFSYLSHLPAQRCRSPGDVGRMWPCLLRTLSNRQRGDVTGESAAAQRCKSNSVQASWKVSVFPCCCPEFVINF